MELKNIVQIKSGKRMPKGTFLSNVKNSHPYIKVKDMQDFKTLAKLGLTGNFIKSIIVFSFVTLLPQLLFLLPSKIDFKGATVTVGYWADYVTGQVINVDGGMLM